MRPRVLGPTVDGETRCIHYRTPLDMIAIKFACCLEFYPCHLCHEELADHSAKQWSAEKQEERAVLCGVCGNVLTVAEYLGTEFCPGCSAKFNPGCKLHAEQYFHR